MIKDHPQKGYFHLDALFPGPLTVDGGNLTGEGSITDRDNDLYREILMALALNPLFRSARETIKTAA
jgi:hypothetical protein